MIVLMTVGLGFAAGETTAYVVGEYRQVLAQAGSSEGEAFAAFLDLAVRRGIITTLGHACWAGIAGYALAGFLISGRRRAIGTIGVFAAAGLHSGFNASSLSLPGAGDGAALMVVAWLAAVGLAIALFTRALSRSPFRRQQLRARLMGMPLLADIPPDRLGAAAERLELVTARAGEVVEALRLNRLFHRTIADAAENPMAVEILEGRSALIYALRRRHGYDAAKVDNVAAEHGAILRALRARDPEWAESAARAHCLSARADSLRALRAAQTD